MQKHILLKSSRLIWVIALMLFSHAVFAQIKVTGTVTDPSGEPIIGANVLVKETSLGSITDLDGHFTVNAPENGSLVVSYIGYLTRNIKISGRNNLKVVLSEDSKALDEVIVIGYGSVKKQNLTSSVSKMTDEAVRERPVATLGEALAGNLAGVRAQSTSGVPGEELQIRIRGVNTINGSSDPLYVIDGVPYESMSDINPADVASIQVLKDASATSIYGARGANGVILIETKQGSDKPAVTFDGFYGLQDPEKYVSMMDAKEWLAFNIWKRNNDHLRSGGSMSDPMSARADANKIPDSWLDPDLETTDWQKAITQVAPVQSYQLSASGKHKMGTIYFSGGYYDQKGIIKETYYNRINFRLNGTLNISDYLKVGANMSASRSKQDNKEAQGKETVIQHALMQAPIVKLDEATRDWGYPNLGITVYPNPLERLKETLDQTVQNKAAISAWAEITFMKGLVFKSQYNYSYDGRVYEYYVPGNVTYNNNHVTLGKSNSQSNNSWSVQNTLTYDALYANKHALNVMLGQSADATDRYRIDGEATGWPLENISTLNVATLAKRASTERYQVRTASFFGRVTYNYKEKYLLNATVRHDGSSRFGTNNRWGWFPSFSAGWKLNEESFLKSVEWISLLKLRASWGKSGNDRIGYYDYLSVLTTDNSAYGNTLQPGMAPKNLKNEDLKWESTASLDFGLDFSAFNNRLQFNFDYYINKTDNLLFNLPIVMTSGYDRIRTNLGSIQNKGWELDITSHNLTGSFKWSTSLNLSGNENKVLDMGGIDSFTDSMWDGKFITRVGGPVSQFYCYRTNGVLTADDFEKKADGTPDENKPLVPVYKGQRIGNVKLVDQPTKMVDGQWVGDGAITEDDLVPYGNNIPDVIYGITNRFSYKNFELSVLIQGQIGGDVMFLGQRSLDYGSPGVNQFSHWVRCWKPDYKAVYGDRGDPTPYDLGVDMSWDGSTPNIYNRNSTYENNSDLRIYDTTYLRIKNITLSYTLPADLLKKSFLKRAKVYVSLDNVATFDNYPGVSPETNSYGNSTTRAGVDYSTYPMSRKYTLGVNLVF